MTDIREILERRAPRTTDDQGNTIILRQATYPNNAMTVSFIDAAGCHHSNIGKVYDGVVTRNVYGEAIEGRPDDRDFVIEYYENQVRQ